MCERMMDALVKPVAGPGLDQFVKALIEEDQLAKLSAFENG